MIINLMLCIAPVLLNHETIELPLVLDLVSFFRQQTWKLKTGFAAPLHISNANVSNVSAAKKTTPTTICEVSNFLGTVHHEYVFTIEEALDALPDVKGPKGLFDRTMDDFREDLDFCEHFGQIHGKSCEQKIWKPNDY